MLNDTNIFTIILLILFVGSQFIPFLVKRKDLPDIAFIQKIILSLVEGIEQESWHFEGSKKENVIAEAKRILSVYKINIPDALLNAAIEQAVLHMNSRIKPK